MAETGAEVRNVTEEQLSVFAPTRESMKELMEWVETFLQEEEVKEVRDLLGDFHRMAPRKSSVLSCT